MDHLDLPTLKRLPVTLAPETETRYRSVVTATLAELVEWYLGAGGVLLHGSWGNRREPPGHGIAPRRLRFPQEDVMPYGNFFVVELCYRVLHEDTPPFGLASDTVPKT